MEFGLLGPLLVRADGSRVTVSAGKQRVLLAALLLSANQVVPAAYLAGAVWDGSPPETARVTLQNYVKRLRQVLGQAGYEGIVTRPGGYLIEAGAAELDLARFAELQQSGRAAARSGAWDTASAQLSAALALWRGQPLADVPSQVLTLAEVPRLAEMRLETLEARIDADLRLGRHQEVITELQVLAAAEPLRERLHELLMLALYRSGQETAALAAYGHARQHLIEEVGIEPGPGLRDLNKRILRADPRLLLTPRARAASTAGQHPGRGHPAGQPEGQHPDPRDPADGNGARLPRPEMLPTAVPGFTGRSRELRALSAMPGQPGGPVLITAIGGTAGVGKTALAVHWARCAAADFPDGQLYVNLRGFGPADPLPAAEALRAFLDALQVPAAQIPDSLDGRQALYRSLLDGKRVLIVLDNARDPDQVRPLLLASCAALVLVTSRNELTSLIAAEGARTLTLGVLSDAEAHQLLAGRLGVARLLAEPAAVSELIRLCARLPLALAVAAARAAAHPGFSLAALAAELRDAHGRLDALSTGEDATDIRAVLSWSYQQLTPAAARMFRLLGVHPGPEITAPSAASLAGLDLAAARRLLRELTRCRLLAEPAPGRFAFHDLLRAYAAEQATVTDSEEERRAATGRMLDHYLHTAYDAALLMQPHRGPLTLDPIRPGVTPERLADSQQAMAWFETEHQVLLAAVFLAAETGLSVQAWQLPWAMASFLDWRGHWDEWAAVHRTAVAVATGLGDKTAEAVARRGLAAACIRLGDLDLGRSHLVACLGLYRQLGDRAGEARIHQDLCGGAEQQSRHAEALGHAERALGLFQAVADQAGEANALNSIGWCHAQLGDPRKARAFCQQALGLYRKLGNRYCEAHTWDSLGFAEHQLGNLARAAACYRQALRLFEELGDRYYQAEALIHFGDTREAAGQPSAADGAWRQALAILDDLQHADTGRLRDKLRRLGTVSQTALEILRPA